MHRSLICVIHDDLESVPKIAPWDLRNEHLCSNPLESTSTLR